MWQPHQSFFHDIFPLDPGQSHDPLPGNGINFVLRGPFKIRTTNSPAMKKLGLEDKKLLRALLSRNLSLQIFLLDACINDIQNIVMSDRMMVRC